MAQGILFGQPEKPFAPAPAAKKAGGPFPVLLRMGSGTHICDLDMTRQTFFLHPLQQGFMISRMKPWIYMQDHNFHPERQFLPIQQKHLEHSPAIHASGNSYSQPGSWPEHGGAVHEPASLAQAGLLGIAKSFCRSAHRRGFFYQGLLPVDDPWQCGYRFSFTQILTRQYSSSTNLEPMSSPVP